MIRTLLRIENLAIFLVSLFFYHGLGLPLLGWPWSVVLFFSPDLSLLGFLIHQRTGAICYNLVHNYALPAILILIGIHLPASSPVLPIGILFAAHVGMDRMLGLGMKYAYSKETHLQKA